MVNHYRDTLGISWEEMKEIEKKDLKKRVREYDTRKWKEGMMNKETLKWYRMRKDSIGYEMCYSNNINSTYLAKARMKSLQLEVHLGRGKKEYDKNCPDLEVRRNRKIINEVDIMTTDEKTPHIFQKQTL